MIIILVIKQIETPNVAVVILKTPPLVTDLFLFYPFLSVLFYTGPVIKPVTQRGDYKFLIWSTGLGDGLCRGSLAIY